VKTTVRWGEKAHVDVKKYCEYKLGAACGNCPAGKIVTNMSGSVTVPVTKNFNDNHTDTVTKVWNADCPPGCPCASTLAQAEPAAPDWWGTP
jgi:hypothetical protein